MLEGTDDLGSLYESFSSSNTTAITTLYKHITPTKMMVGTQDLKDILIPIYIDLAGTFNVGDFDIPTWCSKMAFLLIGGGGGGCANMNNLGGTGGGGGGFSYHLVNVVYGVSTGSFDIGYGGAGSSPTTNNGGNGNNTIITYNGTNYQANGGGGAIYTLASGGTGGNGNYRKGNVGSMGDSIITYVVNSQLKLTYNGVVDEEAVISNDQYKSGDVVGGKGGNGGGSGLSNYTFQNLSGSTYGKGGGGSLGRYYNGGTYNYNFSSPGNGGFARVYFLV